MQHYVTCHISFRRSLQTEASLTIEVQEVHFVLSLYFSSNSIYYK